MFLLFEWKIVYLAHKCTYHIWKSVFLPTYQIWKAVFIITEMLTVLSGPPGKATGRHFEAVLGWGGGDFGLPCVFLANRVDSGLTLCVWI